MTDEESKLFSSRKSALEQRIWSAFEAEDFILEVDSRAGGLLVRNPRHGSTHQFSVEFDVDRAVADWDDLLTHHVNPLERGGWSDLDTVVAEVCDRLWDAAMVASAVVDRLIYKDGHFEGVAEPNRRIWPPASGDGPHRWVLDQSENPPGIGPG